MRQRRDVQVRQDALAFVRRGAHAVPTAPFIAQVVRTYSDRMTCDITTPDGQSLPNIPILTRGGLVDEEPYGEVCLPMADDYVIVMHVSYGARHKAIIGTILPYLANEMTKDAVESGGKQFTKKLFEANTPRSYRRVFPSGTSVEIDDDGYVTVELPNGTYIQIDDEVEIEDQHGNVVVMGSSGITVEDTNGNEIEMGTTSVTINGNLEVLK